MTDAGLVLCLRSGLNDTDGHCRTMGGHSPLLFYLFSHRGGDLFSVKPVSDGNATSVSFSFSRHKEKIQVADNKSTSDQQAVRINLVQPSIRSETGQQAETNPNKC